MFKVNFIKAIAWSSFSSVVVFLINFTLGVWLARILGPGAYGLIAMVMVFVGYGRLIIDFGFGEALVQDQNTADDDYSTIFWFNLLISIILYLASNFLSHSIANFYDLSEIVLLVKVLSLVFIFNAAGIIQKVKLEKAMNFKFLGIADILSSLLSSIIAIILAFKNFGVWSLVFLNLIKAFLNSIFLWMFSSWRPNFVFKIKSLKKYYKFSFSLLMNGLFETIASTLDKIAIGKLLGTNSLGLYNKSFSTVRMPVYQLMNSLGRVIFPALSSIQSNTNSVFLVYIRLVLVISSIMFPMMVVLFFFSYEITSFLFGEKWLDMSPLMAVFSLATGFLPFNILADSVVKSTGKIKYVNLITIIEKPLAVIFVLSGLYFGTLMAVTQMVTLGVFLLFIFKSVIVCKSLGKSIYILLKSHLEGLYVVIVPIITLNMLNYLSYENLSLKLFLITISFIVSFLIFKSKTITPILEILRSSMKN